MPPLAVNVLKVLFVVVLYGFLWVVARAVRSHLSVTPVTSTRTGAIGAVVVIEPKPLAGRLLTVDHPTVVGRAAEADLVLDDPFASDRHARFDRLEGRLVIEDLGSTNGTVVNGVPVVGRRALDRGDAIRIGQTIMEVR